MDSTQEYRRPLLSQDQNLYQGAFQTIQYAQSRNLTGQPIPRGALNTDTTGIRTAGSQQSSSSNSFDFDCFSACTQGTVSQMPHGRIPELSGHVYQSHEDVRTHHPDLDDEAYECGTDEWPSSPVQPQIRKHASQMDNPTSQMNLIASVQGVRESPWTESAEEPQGSFPFAFDMYGVPMNAELNAFNPPETNELCCSGPSFPCHESQESYCSSFQGGHRNSSLGDVPPKLPLLSEQEALRTIGLLGPSSSLRPTTPFGLYPDMGYDSVLDIHAVAANTPLTGSAAESGNPIGSQPAPMWNYHRSPSSSMLPPGSAELSRHVSKPVDLLVASEVSSDISLESQQSVWDMTTGDLVPPKTRRTATDEERAHCQIIRNLGGQCERCRKGKRKCKVSHLEARSEPSIPSPSGRTCSDSESSFVQSSSNKRRKVDQNHLHPQGHAESLQTPDGDRHYRRPHSIPDRSSAREHRSESISSACAVAGSTDTAFMGEAGMFLSDKLHWGSTTFSQDNLGSGGQFSPPPRWFSDTSAHASQGASSPAASPSERGE